MPHVLCLHHVARFSGACARRLTAARQRASVKNESGSHRSGGQNIQLRYAFQVRAG